MMSNIVISNETLYDDTPYHVLLQTFGKVILSPALCCNNNFPSVLNKNIEKALCNIPLGFVVLKVWASFLVDSSILQSFSSTITSFSVAMKFSCPSLNVFLSSDMRGMITSCFLTRPLFLTHLLPLTRLLTPQSAQPLLVYWYMKLRTHSLELIQKRFAHKKRIPYILAI